MNKGYGDFGYTPDLYGTETMGDWWSDQVKKLEKSVQSTLQPVTDFATKIDPNFERSVQDALNKQKVSLQNQATSAAQKLLADKAKSPESQTAAISASFNAAAKYTDTIITSLRAGTLTKTHPAIVYTFGGLVGLLVVSWGLKKVGQGRAKVLVGAAKKTAKANPQKKHKSRSRKARGYAKAKKKVKKR